LFEASPDRNREDSRLKSNLMIGADSISICIFRPITKLHFREAEANAFTVYREFVDDGNNDDDDDARIDAGGNMRKFFLTPAARYCLTEGAVRLCFRF
jgi:hypothetical protein